QAKSPRVETRTSTTLSLPPTGPAQRIAAARGTGRQPGMPGRWRSELRSRPYPFGIRSSFARRSSCFRTSLRPLSSSNALFGILHLSGVRDFAARLLADGEDLAVAVAIKSFFQEGIVRMPRKKPYHPPPDSC